MINKEDFNEDESNEEDSNQNESNQNEPNQDKSKNQKNLININCDEQIAQGAYANLAMSTFNKEEFVLDFIFIQPGGQKGKVRSRVIVSPKNAKRLAMMLIENIKQYEEKCGTISDEPQAPGIQFSTN